MLVQLTNGHRRLESSKSTAVSWAANVHPRNEAFSNCSPDNGTCFV